MGRNRKFSGQEIDIHANNVVAAKWVATGKICCHSMCNVPVCTLGVAVHCTGVFRHIGRKPTVVVRC